MSAKSGQALATVRGVVVCVVVVAAVLAGRQALDAVMNAAPKAPEIGESPPVQVAVRRAQSRRFVELARTQGTLVSRNYSYASPRQDGLIVDIPVREGDWVVKDETVLFTMDDVILKQNVETAERNLDVAKFSLVEKEAGYEKDEADRVRMQRDWERDQTLVKNGTITERDFDTTKANYDKAIAQMKYAESLVELAKSQVKVAESALVKAKKDLADAVVKAPLNGFVTLRAKEPGQSGKPGEAILRIDDVEVLEATGYLPARHYARIVAESQRTAARLLAKLHPALAEHVPVEDRDFPISAVTLTVEGSDPIQRPLTYKAQAVDQGLRTFKIKADIAGDGQRLVPGLLVDIAVELSSDEGVGVPKTALAERRGGTVVFVVESGKAKMIPVELGLESDGWVRVKSDNLPAGAPVIDGGQTLEQINDGSPVHVREENGKTLAPPVPAAPPEAAPAEPAA